MQNREKLDFDCQSKLLPQHRQPFLRRHFVQALHQSRAGSAHVRAVILREGLHQAHHRQGDRGRGHNLLRYHRGDLCGSPADGGTPMNLRMLRRTMKARRSRRRMGCRGDRGVVYGPVSRGVLLSMRLPLLYAIFASSLGA